MVHHEILGSQIQIGRGLIGQSYDETIDNGMNHPASIIHQTSACFYKTCRRFLTNVPRESWRLQSYKLRVADFIGYGYTSEKRNLQPATFIDFRFSPCAITSQSIDYYIFICIYIIYIIKNKKKNSPTGLHTQKKKNT
jgi:hypothetical protein